MVASLASVQQLTSISAEAIREVGDWAGYMKCKGRNSRAYKGLQSGPRVVTTVDGREENVPAQRELREKEAVLVD